MIGFKHSGNLGDIVYSLPAMVALSERLGDRSAALYITSDKLVARADPGYWHPGGRYMMNRALFDFIEPLLSRQSYVVRVEFLPEEQIPAAAIDFDIIRSGQLNLSAGNIKDYYFKAFGLVADGAKPWIESPARIESGAVDVVIGRSTRYLNQSINYSLLNELGLSMGFLGTDAEFRAFSERFHVRHLEKLPAKDASEASQWISASRLFIGNQSLFFAIAEGLKCHRILESYEPVPNVLPQGGRSGQFVTTQGLLQLTNDLVGTSVDGRNYASVAAQYVLSVGVGS
jgi:hypothetical protein